MLRKWRSLVCLVSLSAAIVLVTSILGALPGMAAQGDIWTQPAGTPEETSGHSQEVHLPCGDVDIWVDKLTEGDHTWVVYHMPPPNPLGPHTQVTEGSFTYSGDFALKVDTIPMSELHKANGPHFKVEVDNDNNKSKTFWVDCQTHITTTTSPANAVVGQILNDTATLSMGFSPTGTITFTLYGPSGAVAHTETVSVGHGNGVYSTTAGHVADAAGTWQWKAAYVSADQQANANASTNLLDEPVVVTEVPRVQPSITTVPTPASGVLGAVLQDSATLSGGSSPQGTITFSLFDPVNSSIPAQTWVVSVAGNGAYATPTGYVADMVGTWHWVAAYSGDSHNLPVTSGAEDE